MKYVIAILLIPFMLIGIISAVLWLGVLSGWELAIEKLAGYFYRPEQDDEIPDKEIEKAVREMMEQAKRSAN